MKIKLLMIIMTLNFVSTAHASLMRLELSGTIVDNYPAQGNGPLGFYSAYFIIDTSTPDENPQVDIGAYAAVISGFVNWNGIESDQSASTLSIRNDSFIINDQFVILAAGPGEGVFFFQLGNLTTNVFSDDSIPTSLELALFDELELDNVQSTGVFSFVGDSSFQASIDTLAYYVVPVPAAFWLMLSGFIALLTPRFKFLR